MSKVVAESGESEFLTSDLLVGVPGVLSSTGSSLLVSLTCMSGVVPKPMLSSVYY